MAVTTTTRSVSYTASGAETSFAVPFRFLEDSHLVVELDGVAQTLGADYTVQGAGGSSGSVVPTSSFTGDLVITRVVPLTQETSLRSYGSFSPAVHETALDLLTMQAQQFDDKIDAEAATRAAVDAAHELALSLGAVGGSGTYVTAEGSTTAHTLANWMAAEGAARLVQSLASEQPPADPAAQPAWVDVGGPASRLPAFSVKINALDVCFIRQAWDASNDIVMKAEVNVGQTPTDNDEVHLLEAKLIPIATLDDDMDAAFNASVTTISSQSDEAPVPLYNSQRNGAAHGPLSTLNITVTGHDKTAVDVGSQWTDGGAKVWTIVAIIDANTLRIMPNNTGTATVWNFPTSITGTTLTHSSGATHSGGITFSSPTVTQQKPEISNLTKVITMDGVICGLGVYRGRDFTVTENYDIPNQAAALDFVKAHVGSDPAPALNDASIAVQVHIQGIHRWVPRGAYTLDQTITVVQEIQLAGGYFGPTQGNAPTYSGKTLRLYVPKLNAWTGAVSYDLTNAPLDISGVMPETIVLDDAKWSDAANPPDRMVMTVDLAGVRSIGFAIGSSLRVGVGVPASRAALTNQSGYIATFKKMYPYAVDGFANSIIAAGTAYRIFGYRALFNSADMPDATALYWIREDNGDVVVYVDIHQTVSDLPIPLPAEWFGCTVELVEKSSSASLGAAMVDLNGHLPITTTGGYGYAVFRVRAPPSLKLWYGTEWSA